MRIFILCIFLVGCGSDDVNIEGVCEKWDGCREWDYGPPALDECPYRYLQLSEACLSELNDAICSSLSVQEADKLTTICWPECLPTVTYCRADYLVKCDGHEWVTDCVRLCESTGSTGICGEVETGIVECICE